MSNNESGREDRDGLTIDFVKGHCGWDTVTLVPAGQVAVTDELRTALKILDAPHCGGLEVGFMQPAGQPNAIRLRIVASTQRDWIPMCGGMTQVIGKAMLETSFRDRFRIDLATPTITLVTEAGVVPVQIRADGDRAFQIWTIMDKYVDYLHHEGVEPMTLMDVEVLRVGDYIIIDVDSLECVHPGVDFSRRDPGEHLEVIHRLLEQFCQERKLYGVSCMMYDNRPEGSGQFRIFPRFYSADRAAASIPWEFQCGTGTVATGVAIAHRGTLPFRGDSGRILFEWGSRRRTPDPYGIRTSTLALGLRGGRVRRANFSHSVVEILAEGKLRLPWY